ncbi:MAG: STAS domain-containing protein [Verrucomicrobiales bacterium]|nr:STAS domain-containing protein [Verrucomicrobiales bacterium]
MKFTVTDDRRLKVTDLKELVAGNASQLREEVRHSLTEECKGVDIDLSQTSFVDSSGLGALIAIQKSLRLHHGNLRLLEPSASAMQVIELTRLHQFFEIIPKPKSPGLVGG